MPDKEVAVCELGAVRLPLGRLGVPSAPWSFCEADSFWLGVNVTVMVRAASEGVFLRSTATF